MRILLLGFLVVGGLAYSWSDPIDISPDTVPPGRPAICTASRTSPCVCWCAWRERKPWSAYREEESWQPLLVSSTECIYPEVTTNSMCEGSPWGLPCVAWVDSEGYIRVSILESFSQTPYWVTSMRDRRVMGRNPAITADSLGYLWCVWTGLDTSGVEYSYDVSLCLTWYDLQWWPPFRLRQFTAEDVTYTAGITTDSLGRVWVAYNEAELIWSHCLEGDTWSGPDSVGFCNDYAYPTLCAGSSGVWVAWYADYVDSLGGELYLAHNRDGTWSDPIEFPKPGGGIYRGWQKPHPDICVDAEDKLWAAWWWDWGITGENHMICASSYVEDWGAVDTVYSAPAPGGYPSIVCDRDTVWVVWWRLGGISLSYRQTTAIQEIVASQRFLPHLRAYPTPFSSYATIQYNLVEDSEVTLRVYSSSGRKVRTVTDMHKSAGHHTITWNATDDTGRRVPSGTYILRLEVGEHARTKKVVVLW